jgi:hypothetical protein
MILQDNAYDVVQGFVGAPIGTFSEFKKTAPASGSATSDEELLQGFLKG